MSISFQKVHKRFNPGLFQKKVQAVYNFSLDVHPGEVLGIVGPNGAGKSTILKILLGFIRATSGTVTIDGRSPAEADVRTKIGFLPENPYFYDYLSAEELMRFSAVTAGMPSESIKPRMDELLQTLALDHARKRKLRSYSKGMTQRAGICFALIHDPEIIILDEPMSGLDPIGRKLVVDLILTLKKQGKTILFCSHILNDVERLCDRVAIMAKGQLKTILDKENLVSQQTQIKVYVPEMSADQVQVLHTIGAEKKQEGKSTAIICQKSNLPRVMLFLSEQKLECEHLDVVSNVLEREFLRWLEGGK
ncbi:MAG: ABC transporter ATP-binding protein [Desulfobulbaceae bacterium]|nr:ABC transporter ATP-binding protein [Desulfobulbaceae bacterium]